MASVPPPPRPVAPVLTNTHARAGDAFVYTERTMRVPTWTRYYFVLHDLVLYQFADGTVKRIWELVVEGSWAWGDGAGR